MEYENKLIKLLNSLCPSLCVIGTTQKLKSVLYYK